MGALTLQYLMHFMVLRLTRVIFDNMEDFLADRRPSPVASGNQLLLHDGLPESASVADFEE
jgi:hypothetical protein